MKVDNAIPAATNFSTISFISVEDFPICLAQSLVQQYLQATLKSNKESQ